MEPTDTVRRPYAAVYQAGAWVTIREGTFAGMEGEIKAVLPPLGQVRVEVTIFGRPVPVELDCEQVVLRDGPTEAEWRACTSLPGLTRCLKALGLTLGPRRLRLFACACAGRVVGALKDGSFRRALAVGERYADGQAGDLELAAARAVAERVAEQLDFSGPRPRAFAAAVRAALDPDAAAAARGAAEAAADCPGQPLWQAAAFRDLAGSPFRAPAIDPAWPRWHDGFVGKMAQAIYDGRRFEDLPVLADALEDAGCQEAALLEHCRAGGTHVRGCWLLDHLLGYSPTHDMTRSEIPVR
jgi:hypothetical protein